MYFLTMDSSPGRPTTPQRPIALILAVGIYLLVAVSLSIAGVVAIGLALVSGIGLVGYGPYLLFAGVVLTLVSVTMLAAALKAAGGSDASRVVLTSCAALFLFFIGMMQNGFSFGLGGAEYGLKAVVQFGPALATVLLWLPSCRAYFQQQAQLRKALSR